MNPPDYGRCTPFLQRALDVYAPILTRDAFEFVDCTAKDSGRGPLCTAMYRSNELALLFTLADGSEATGIAAPETVFPVYGWNGTDGKDGWYSVVGLVEYVNNKKKLLTQKLMDEFMRGKRDYLVWEYDLASRYFDRLLE